MDEYSDRTAGLPGGRHGIVQHEAVAVGQPQYVSPGRQPDLGAREQMSEQRLYVRVAQEG